MKPNEYKIYRKLELAVTEFLSAFGQENAEITDWSDPSSLFLAEGAGELVHAASDILSRSLTAEDEAGLLAMIRDEVQDGTIDFTDLGRYHLYQDQGVDPAASAVGVQKLSPEKRHGENLFGEASRGQDSCPKSGSASDLAGETMQLIRNQLAELSLIEHRIARMKEELFALADRLEK